MRKKLLFILCLFSILIPTIEAQTVKELFTREGLALNSKHENYYEGTWSRSVVYYGIDTVCDMEVARYYYNRSKAIINISFEEDRMYVVKNCEKKLLYDFSLSVGDSITEGFYAGLKVIDKYDVTLSNGEVRTRWDLIKGFNERSSWIEGIGDVVRSFIPDFNDFEGGDVFICAKVDTTLLWESEDPDVAFECESYSCVYPKLKFEIIQDDFYVEVLDHSLYGNEYLWDWGDGTQSTEINPSHTYENPGCYKVTLKLINDCYSEQKVLTKIVSACSKDAWSVYVDQDTTGDFRMYNFGDSLKYIINDSIFYKLIDNTWEQISFTPIDKKSIRSFKIWDENRMMMTGNSNSVYISQDGGETWLLKLPDSYTINFGDYVLGDNGEAWISRGGYVHNYYRTLDYGVTWEEIDLGTDNLIGFQNIGNDTIYAYSLRGLLGPTITFVQAKSYDNGSTWTYMESIYSQARVKYFNSKLAYNIHEDGFYITQDAGLNWEKKDLPFKIRSFSFSSPTHGWVIDTDNLVYYTTDSLSSFQVTNCSLGVINVLHASNDSIAYGVKYGDDYPEIIGTKYVFDKNNLGNCDQLTDHDGDGFIGNEDCDDSDPSINPDATEIPYNGIDEDCDESTLDDDLDQDGFILADDCDDNDPDVNPNAEEIEDNEIDDDCDGLVDEITSTANIDDTTISIYPNPARNILTIDVPNDFIYKVKLIDLKGIVVLSQTNINKIDVGKYLNGLYLIEIRDLVSGKKIAKMISINH